MSVIETQRFFARKSNGTFCHVEAQPLFTTYLDQVTASDTINELIGLPGQPAYSKQDLSKPVAWNITEMSFDSYVRLLRQQIKEQEEDERNRIAWHKALELAGALLDAASWLAPPARIALLFEVAVKALSYAVKASQVLFADNQREGAVELGVDLILSVCLNTSYDFIVLKKGPFSLAETAINRSWTMDTTASDASLFSCSVVKLGVTYSKNQPTSVAPSTWELDRAYQFLYHADSEYRARTDAFRDLRTRWTAPPVIQDVIVSQTPDGFYYILKVSGTNLFLSSAVFKDDRGSLQSFRFDGAGADQYKGTLHIPATFSGQRRMFVYSSGNGCSNGYSVTFK